MLNTRQTENKYAELEKNIVFVSTIYDTFEALEETLGKLKLEQPLFLTYIAKKAFAEEVFKYAQKDEGIYLADYPKPKEEKRVLQ